MLPKLILELSGKYIECPDPTKTLLLVVTIPTNVETPTANTSPSGLSVTPEPTLTLEVAVKIPVTTAPVSAVLNLLVHQFDTRWNF